MSRKWKRGTSGLECSSGVSNVGHSDTAHTQLPAQWLLRALETVEVVPLLLVQWLLKAWKVLKVVPSLPIQWLLNVVSRSPSFSPSYPTHRPTYLNSLTIEGLASTLVSSVVPPGTCCVWKRNYLNLQQTNSNNSRTWYMLDIRY